MYFIEIYGKETCVYCDRSKDILEELELDYTYYDVEENTKNLQEMLSRIPGAKTVPQILINDVSIGGYDDLRLELKRIGAK